MVALARVDNGIERAEPFLPAEKIQLLKDTLLKGATDLELQLFVTQCEKRRLDPFTRQFYGIKTGQGLQMFASIDGLRVIAQRSGEYRGQVGPLWCGPDGQWADVWIAQEPPAAAKVGVLRAGWTEPLWGVATFKSYGAGKQSPVWRTMPDVMLAKAAEALALRKAFPDDMSGIYTPEEIEHEEPKHVRMQNTVIKAMADMPSADDAEDDAIDADPETGEIIEAEVKPIDTVDSLRAEITHLRERLGWTGQDVVDEAAKQQPPIPIRTFAGMQQMRDLLTEYVEGA